MLLHQLLIFTKVAEEKNFSRAAESIFLSQSTVSTHINNLEKYFGQKLFDRTGKEVVITSFGEKLYPYAKEILAIQEKVMWELKDMHKVEGLIKIAASTVPAQYILPGLISRFSHKYPGIKFAVESTDSKGVSELLAKGKADLGIMGNQYIPDKLEFIPIIEERLILAAPPDYNLSGNVSLKDLMDFPFLFRKYGSGTQAIIEKTLHKAGVDISKLNVIGRFDSVQTVKQCIKEGMGISIISEIAVADYVQQNFIKTYELNEFTEKRTFYLAYNKGRTLPPAVHEFIVQSRHELAT